MNQEEFIRTIAQYVQKYAPMYNIQVYSPIIAQAILKSSSGTSELAVKANNFFGIKYHISVSDKSPYIKVGSEQSSDGKYTESVMQWCNFNTIESGVHGYFKFLFERKGVTRYENLKNITDPSFYLNMIKQDGYATSLNYVDNLMNVIKKYNLTQYDKKGINVMRINIHAGHNADGKIACGAIGLIKESTEARKVKDLVIAKLKTLGHTVYDCTVDNAASQSANLRQIVANCNAHAVDLDVSIHFNSGANDKGGNGVTTGTEVLLYSASSKAKTYADNTAKAIAELGFKNRGIKYRTNLYVLKNTKSPAMLIECCFVDDKDDVTRYNAETMATAIVKGITGQSVANAPTTAVNTPTTNAVSVSDKLKAKGLELAKKWVKGATKPITADNAKAMVVQYALNLDYKSGLVIDGSFGTKSKTALGSHYVKQGETQYLVSAAELIMYLLGKDPNGFEEKGHFGNGLAKASGKTKITAQDFIAYINTK